MRQVVLHPDREDGGWVVEVPSLPGCVSQGETKAEALANIREAIDSWVEAARANGIDVPRRGTRRAATLSRRDPKRGDA